MGPGSCTPNRAPPQPHWYTATTAPRDASTESRKPRVAITGTSTERNTMSSSSSEMSMTTPRYSGSFSPSSWETSMFAAVVPATPTWTSSWDSRSPLRSRMLPTSSSVAASAGPDSGITWITPVARSSVSCPGSTLATSSWAASWSETTLIFSCASALLRPSGRSTTTAMGPFSPAPKSSAMRWYALYCVLSSASMEASGRPRRMLCAGIASTISTAAHASVVIHGWRRCRGTLCSSMLSSCGAALRCFLGSTRRPASESSAGVRVRVSSRATSTASPAVVPMSPRKGMPVTFSATRATITVSAAKNTAVPEVPTARPIDSRTSTPRRSCWRCRLSTNSE